MKKIMLGVVLCICSCISLQAMDINYESERFDGKTYFIIRFEDSNTYSVLDNTIFKFYLNDGSTFRLSGKEAGRNNEGSDVFHIYIFEVTKDMHDAFSKGVKGVVVNTVPRIYKDRISKNDTGNFLDLIENPKETDDIDKKK